MIVRIATEGQYELGEDSSAALAELDDQVLAACQAGDEPAFRGSFDRLLGLIRSGRRLAEDDLVASDLIVPPPDVSLEEAKAEFSGEGLIPG